MDGSTGLKVEPLWARVDRNRVKLAVFVALFVSGSALLIASALIALPGSLIGGALILMESVEAGSYFGTLALVFGGGLLLLLALGGILAAVQLSNAEDWVRNRFQGSDLPAGQYPGFERAVSDMAVAGGLPEVPRLLLLDVPSLNACAIGLRRKVPVIGVTKGMLDWFEEEEQRAVVATLTARIIAGDILFGTAMAALMGPMRAIREAKGSAAGVGQACGCAGDGCIEGCADSGGCLTDSLGDSDIGGGCLGAIAVAVFLAFVAAVTWLALKASAWIVTAWGRMLHRTSYEKADAEGMLLLKDPSPMLSALDKTIRSPNQVADGDPSYDGIFYASTSGTRAVEAVEARRYERLRQVLATEGLAARGADQ